MFYYKGHNVNKEQKFPKFVEIVSIIFGNIPVWCERNVTEFCKHTLQF